MQDTPAGGCHKLPTRGLRVASDCDTRDKPAARCAVCGGPWPDGSGCEFCPAVDPPAEKHENAQPEGRSGDVDANGEIVDLLLVRLRNAVGPDIADDVNPDDQVLLARTLLAARGIS